MRSKYVGFWFTYQCWPQVQAKLWIHVWFFFGSLTKLSKLLGHLCAQRALFPVGGLAPNWGAAARKAAGAAAGVVAAANVALPATAFGLITLPTQASSFGNSLFLSNLGIPRSTNLHIWMSLIDSLPELIIRQASLSQNRWFFQLGKTSKLKKL